MASGNSLCAWRAQDGIPPSTNFATRNYRNGHPILEFDPTTEWATYFEDVLPRHYGGGGLTLNLWWSSAGNSGTAKWGGSIERQDEAGTDLDSDSFATEQTATGTAPGTSGQLRKTTITFTSGANMDSLAVGEPFRLKVARKAADAADTMDSDKGQLWAAELVET